MNNIQDKDIRKIISEYLKASYQPEVILNESQRCLVDAYVNKQGLEHDRLFKTLTPEVQGWIATSISIGTYYNSNTHKPSDILDHVWEFLSNFIFPGKRLTMLINNGKEYISTAEKEYIAYVRDHEEIMNEIQSQIDIINKRKPLMKEYILKKVAERLTIMGIKSEVADYPMESLDRRKFGLNEEFNDICKSFKEVQESSYTKFLEILPCGPLGLGILGNVLVQYRIRQIENQIKNIKNQTGLVFEKMRSDNIKIGDLYMALKNIAEIFTDITTRFIPAIEKILDVIKIKYHDSLSEIPYEVLCLLRTITQILKCISEKCIIPKAERDELIDSTISTSNNMSVEYEKLRQTMASAA